MVQQTLPALHYFKKSFEVFLILHYLNSVCVCVCVCVCVSLCMCMSVYMSVLQEKQHFSYMLSRAESK